ncbi:MAG: DUF748 domain-containing protein [Steroidobacteraceae bacterium]
MPNAASTARTINHPLPWLARRWRLLGVFGVALVIYSLLGFLLVPYLIGKYATEYVRDNMQRQLTLGQVQFNPFTLTVQITQAQLSEANGDPIGRFNYLLVNAELSSLFTGSYNFKKIQLNSPSVQVIVDVQGKLNLDFSDPNAPVEAATTTQLPAVRIDELQLASGFIHVEDHTRPRPFRTDFTPIQFTLKDFRTQPDYGNAFHFSGASEAGESFDWQGDFTVQPLGSTGKLQIAGLQATTLQNYLQDALPFRLLNGALSMQGDYQLAVNENMDLKLDLATINAADTQIAPLTDGNTPWVTIPQLVIANTQVSLRDRSVKMQQVKLTDANITAWLDANYNLNLLELLGPDEPSDEPWSSTVAEIVADNATVQVQDRSITPAADFKLSPASLRVQNFSTAPGTQITLDTTLKINDRADFNASGNVDLDTLSSQLKIRLNNFALKDAQNYAAASTDMLVSDGALNAEGDAYYKGKATNKNPDIKFTGNVEVTNLSTQDKAEGKDFIKWQSVQLKNMNFSLAPDVLEVEQIVTRKPYGRVIINSDGSTNIQHVLRVQPETEETSNKETSTAKPAATPGMRTRIAKVIVQDGSANFTDNSVQPIFSTGMQRLNGTVTGLSSANDSRAKIKLDGAVDNYAPVAITGEANFLAADTYSDIALNFRNMELTTFNPYSGKFAGYSIAKGKLATEIRYQIRDRKLDAQHHIVIDQLEFGAATDSKDAVPLPIKLAVSLLKDRNGVIDLNLPVNGSIDDPKFKVGPIIWKAFVGLLTKIVTAPFSALGALFGGGDELAYVDFTPGSAALSAAETDKLNKLAKAMVERPQLKLNVPLTVVNDTDAAAMNEAAFNNALNAILPSANTATQTQRLTALTTLYQRRLSAAPTFPTATDPATPETLAARIAYLEAQLKPLFAISAADRDVLTRNRADAVQATLLANTELSAERVFLTARSNEAQSPADTVRMELKLE